MKRFVIVAGTRPEIIKVAPIIRKLIDRKINFKFIYSGQHYDHRLSTQIINDLELPMPDFSLKLKSKTPASQVAEIMTNLADQLGKKDDAVIVQGDTSTAFIASLSSFYNKIVHPESRKTAIEVVDNAIKNKSKNIEYVHKTLMQNGEEK